VHGGYSERSIEAKATEVRATLLDIAPWLDEPEFAPAVARFLRAEARALLVHDHVAKTAHEKGTQAVPSRLWEQATACDRLAAQLGNVLGLDPLGRARLQQLTAGTQLTVASLAELASEGRKIRERAQSTMPTTEAVIVSEAPKPLDGAVDADGTTEGADDA
jgi:hypothetical protein